MKRLLSLIIICLCSLFDSFSLKAQEAIYIFRNDEQLLSAFFYSEIDSITYSAYDEAGVVHNEYVAQVVHTPDSVYRIPLAVIDSVTFVQPETIYQPGAYELDARYTPYVKTVDSLTITFMSSLPPDLKPSKGNVLYNFTYQAPFERGFLGRVKSVNTNADGIVVDCDLADITEVFEQYVSYQIHTPDGAETKTVTSDETETINKDFALEFSHKIGKTGSFTLGGNLNYNATIRTVVLVLDGQKNICIQSTEEYALTATYGLGLEGSVDSVKNILFPIRFPVGILECSIQPQICFEINASATLNAGVSYSFKVYHEYGNINGEEYDGKHDYEFDNKFNCSGDLTLEGSALIGLNYQIGIGLPMQSFGVGLDLQAAPQFSGAVTLEPSLDPDANTKLYESTKDANISLTAVANISPCAIVMGKKIWKSDKNKFSFNISKPIWTRYLFPEFSELSVNPKVGTADISSVVSRDVIFPQKIGYALYDENGGLKGTVYNPTNLWINEEFKNPMNLSFEQLEYNKEYTVYPVINLWDKNILANPAKTFKLDLDLDITTGNATDITTDAAVCHGRIYPIEDTSITYGICYGTTPTLSAGTNTIVPATADENGNFNAYLSGLQENSVYYYCAYIMLNGKYQYGEVKSFKTLNKEEEGGDQPGGENVDPEDLRALLIQLYKDTNGDSWKRNDNWCSEKPIEGWYGVEYGDKWNTGTISLGLDLRDNNLVGTINLKDCKVINYLFCSKNALTSIDVGNCTLLSNLSCENNHLTSINVVGCSHNSFGLNCFNNSLTVLDLSGCVYLSSLNCSNNKIANLDVNGCGWLEKLECVNNKIATLNIAKCYILKELLCYNNLLTSLDMTDCAAIKTIDCSKNRINAEIPEIFKYLKPNFSYDKKYVYSKDNQGNTTYTTNEYGWWYPGEPGKGYHGE